MIRLFLIAIAMVSLVDTADAKRRGRGHSSSPSYNNQPRAYTPARPRIHPRARIRPHHIILPMMLFGDSPAEDQVCVWYPTGWFCV